MDTTLPAFTLPALPAELRWHIPPVDWRFDPATGQSITAGPKTDLFSDAAGSIVIDNAPCALMTPPDPSFLLSAKVSVGFASTYDAGALQIRVSDDRWAKLCSEYPPQGQPMVVSVVNRGVSDDCNSVVIDGAEVYLRMARTPRTLADSSFETGYSTFQSIDVAMLINRVAGFALAVVIGIVIGVLIQMAARKR